jgi:hypothetical protein
VEKVPPIKKFNEAWERLNGQFMHGEEKSGRAGSEKFGNGVERYKIF